MVKFDNAFLSADDFTYNIPGGVNQCLMDTDFSILRMNDTFHDMFGFTKQEIEDIFQNKLILMVYPMDREHVRQEIRAQLNRGHFVECEYRIQCKDSSLIWVLNKGKLHILPDGTRTFLCVLVDVTERKEMEEALRLSLERHKVIMNQATDIIFEWDILKDTLLFSVNWQKKFGYVPITKNVSYGIPRSPNIPSEDMKNFTNLMEAMRSGVPYAETEFRIRNIIRQYVWCRVRATAQFDSYGNPIKAVGVIVDINMEKQLRQELIARADQDSLTGLYNKAAVKNHIEKTIAALGKDSAALFILDLDNFKIINDTYGHLCGDSVISSTAYVLKRMFRSTDIIGRIGGDEFLIFLPGFSREDAKKRALGIPAALENIELPDEEHHISASIGIACYPHDANNYLELYRKADISLYYTKNTKKGGVTLYDSSLVMNSKSEIQEQSAISAVIDSDKLTQVEEKLALYSFHLLYQTHSIPETITHLLETVGKSYNICRVFIVEAWEDASVSITYEWCNRGIPSRKSALPDTLAPAGAFNETGCFYCPDISLLDMPVKERLHSLGVHSLFQCAIQDDGICRGYIGYDVCKRNILWEPVEQQALSLIANVLSEFIIKHHLKQCLEIQQTHAEKPVL